MSVFNNLDSQELKTQIYGTNANQQTAIKTDENGILLTALADSSGMPYSMPITAFDDVRSTNLTPMAGWTFNYNINTDYINTATANGGTVTQADGMAVLSTTTTADSSARIATRRVMRYTPGLGGLARFTGIFSAGVADSVQIIGLGDDMDGFISAITARLFRSSGFRTARRTGLRKPAGTEIKWMAAALRHDARPDQGQRIRNSIPMARLRGDQLLYHLHDNRIARIGAPDRIREYGDAAIRI
jgi:hypothetical protein